MTMMMTMTKSGIKRINMKIKRISINMKIKRIRVLLLFLWTFLISMYMILHVYGNGAIKRFAYYFLFPKIDPKNGTTKLV